MNSSLPENDRDELDLDFDAVYLDKPRLHPLLGFVIFFLLTLVYVQFWIWLFKGF